MMDIQELREKIDRVDDDLVRLYGERMELAREIGRYKRHGTGAEPAQPGWRKGRAGE